MIRTLWIVFSAFCVALFVSELLGVGFVWSQGQLTLARLREVRDLFGPQEKEVVAADTETQRILPSSEDVLRERSLRVLSLSSRETEVDLLRTMLDTERNNLITQLADFQKQKEAFQKQLLQLSEESTVAAREQARAVLLQLPPADAVARLMQLSIEEDVLLMREMPEPKIALILKEFAPTTEGGNEGAAAASKDAQARQERAKEIFRRISTGEPKEGIIRSALNGLQPAETERPIPANNNANPK
jgi:hypothetical protein